MLNAELATFNTAMLTVIVVALFCSMRPAELATFDTALLTVCYCSIQCSVGMTVCFQPSTVL